MNITETIISLEEQVLKLKSDLDLAKKALRTIVNDASAMSDFAESVLKAMEEK